MTKPQAKTPIMILQECCAKKVNFKCMTIYISSDSQLIFQNPKDLPIYTEISEVPEEYAEISMRFFIKCQALRLEAVGGGVTKKIAKHTAAEKLLNKYLKNEDDEELQLLQTVDTNCITDLMDYCVLKGYHKVRILKLL